MKKSILVLTLMLLYGSLQAQAIVFVPPIVYFTTISIVSFITNIFLALAVWLAVKGLANRLYFGQPLHTIVSNMLGWLGSSFVIVVSSLVPISVMHPIFVKDLALSSILAGLLCFLLLFVGSYRKIKAEQEYRKKSWIRIILTSIVVIILSFVSASFAVKTSTLHNDSAGNTKFTENSDIKIASGALSKAGAPSMVADSQSSPSPSMVSKIKKEIGQEMQPSAPMVSDMPPENPKAASIKKIDALWFYPSDASTCRIYFDQKLVLSEKPEMNCYYIDDSNKKVKMYCPIQLKLDIASKEGKPFGTIQANGSCSDSFKVRIDESGFVKE